MIAPALLIDLDSPHTIMGPKSRVDAAARALGCVVWIRACETKATIVYMDGGRIKRKSRSRIKFFRSGGRSARIVGVRDV